MKQTILNALWAKIKNTFVGKNSDATLNSLNITGTGINISTTGSGSGGINISGTGINISTTGSGSGGINISGDNYSLKVGSGTIINNTGIKVDNSGYITVGTGSSSSVQIHSGYVTVDSGYIIGSGWCLKKDEVRFTVPTKINQYLYLPDGGIDVNNNSILISGNGISVKSGAVYITSGGISVKSGVIIDSKDIKLNNSSGSIQFNNNNQKIQGYTGTGTGKTTMSNILIDSSNIINIGSDYTIASSGIPIENTDTLNQALGKLEKRIEDIELVTAASLTDLDNRLKEIE